MNNRHVRIRSLSVWLWDARHFLLAFGTVLIALVVVSFAPTERAIRLTGLVLQILGIATVLWGVSETRTLFGRPSVARKVKNLLGQFLDGRRRADVSESGINVSASFVGGRMHSIYSPKEGNTSDQRFLMLEKNVIAIHERIQNAEAEIDLAIRKSEESLDRERRARESEDKAIKERQEAAGIGGVHISAIGALWLFFGAVLSTASPEISALVGSATN